MSNFSEDCDISPAWQCALLGVEVMSNFSEDCDFKEFLEINKSL